jgi:hypothetical protein
MGPVSYWQISLYYYSLQVQQEWNVEVKQDSHPKPQSTLSLALKLQFPP